MFVQFRLWKFGKVFGGIYGDILKINPTLLKAEMAITKNCIHESNTTPSSMKNRDVMMRKLGTKETFLNLFKCFKVAAIIPISSTSCERSFSSRLGLQWHKTGFQISPCGILKRRFWSRVNTYSVVERFSLKPRKLHFK